MRTLRELPGGRATATEYADWLEIEALLASDGNASQEDLARAINRPGIVGEERARTLAADAFVEIGDRIQACGTGQSPNASYPFKLIEDDVLLEVTTTVEMLDSGLVYLFLLAITRGSMSSEYRRLLGVDPTKTFERLCADVLACFWGGRTEYSGAFIIGTAEAREGKGFSGQIDALCCRLDEGAGWKKRARSPGAGDGGLDAVVWRKFRDKRPGGLVGFAQCKTGEHWREHLGKLNPRAFCGKYMTTPLLVDPLGIYMIPHRLDGTEWEDRTRESRGLFFDRCRIVQHAGEVEDECLDECRKWLREAITKSVVA